MRAAVPLGPGSPPIVFPPWCPGSVPSVPRWLNTLGLLASQGIDVVVRHSFLDHGHNHLVDQNFNPLPVGLPRDAMLVLASSCTFGGVLSLWSLLTLLENSFSRSVPYSVNRRC